MNEQIETHRSTTPLLELDLLNTLVAITEAGNFSAAGALVHRTPSAVSIQVKRIEELVGRPVFIRDSRSVSLTSDGEMLLAHARRVLGLNREIMGRFEISGLAGEVRLGALDHATELFLPELLCRFADSHPNVVVDVTVDNSSQLEDLLSRRQIDVALVACGASGEISAGLEILMLEPLVWAGVRGGVAAEREPLSLSVWEEGCIWRTSALEALELAQRDYRITFKSAHIAGQKAAVIADMAVAPLPASACTGEVIALGPESGLPPLPSTAIGILVMEDAPEPVRSLIEYLRSSLAPTPA